MSVPPTGPNPELIAALRAALGANYEIERLLGQGGMGSVYLAKDLTLDRLVAVKVISPDVADASTVRDRFLLEARSVARLRHPNIVSVYSAGESSGLAWFVMEYVPGESLRELLEREKSVTGERAERIVHEIALALDYAHTHGLVHRDVKPENILLDAESGRAMLTDFGIARAFEKDSAMTQAGMILGSPRYMAPEQASGDREIDGRSDLYTLALVAYELFSGIPVVGTGSISSMLVKHVTETPPPLAGKVKGISLVVSNAIERGLEKDPDKRWQTGRAFAAAITGAPLPASGEFRRAPARGRFGPMQRGTLAAAVLVVAVLGWFGVKRFGGPASTAYLVTPFEVQSGDPTVRWLREGSVNMLTLTLGQWADLNVINYERTLSLLDAASLAGKDRLSLDDALDLARKAGAGTVVTGQVATPGDSLIVVAKLFDVKSGKPLQQAQQGMLKGGDPRPLFDRLAQDLLKIAGGPASGMQLSQATTTNLAAYRAYLEGVRYLNSWNLEEADKAFATAIALDSTFALAHHKRSLGLGWSQAGGEMYLKSAETAAALAKRLPAREQALVMGHFHLAQGMAASLAAAGRGDRKEFDAAKAAYRALIARDSMVAEAWYGLADANFHGRAFIQNGDTVLAYAAEALRAFNRTLAIDSTFHLAYSHLVQLYNAGALPNSGMLVVGDTGVISPGKAGAAAEAYRASASARGIAIARAWVRAEPTSVTPIAQLAQSFQSANYPDSAIRLLKDAIANPATSHPTLRAVLLSTQLPSPDADLAASLNYILDHYTADSLRRLSEGERFFSSGVAVTAAGLTGRTVDVERAAKLFESANPFVPFSKTSAGPFIRMNRIAMRLALGEPVSASEHRELLAMIRGIDTVSRSDGALLRNSSVAIPLLGFLATRDTTYSHFVKKWTPAITWPEFDALLALEKGDTATAEKIARAFPTPDSLRKPTVRFGQGSLRSLTKAEVLAEAGLLRQAAETYEAIELARVNLNSAIEPGMVSLLRSYLTRARLWRGLGERDKSIAAYERFIDAWRNAEGAPAKEVAVARQELAALRDSPR